MAAVLCVHESVHLPFSSMFFNLRQIIKQRPIIKKSKSLRLLGSAFNTYNYVDQSNKDQEFYLFVAHKWIEGYEKKFHITSYLMLMLFIVSAGILIFFNQFIPNLFEDLIYLGLVFFFPIVGFISSILGKGRRMLFLCIIHFLLFFVGIFMYFIMS